MNNADRFKQTFGIYAEEFWSFDEKQMLDWLNADVPDTNVGDTISRQAAIDALEREKTYCTAYKDGYSKTDVFKQYNMGLTDGIKALNKLPSAQPDYDLSHYSDKLWKAAYERGKAEAEPRWIPCDIAMPSEPFGCLVTVWDEEPMTGEMFENLLPYFVGWDGEQWNDSDGEQCPFEVIAWMPLPEPYREETENAVH